MMSVNGPLDPKEVRGSCCMQRRRMAQRRAEARPSLPDFVLALTHSAAQPNLREAGWAGPRHRAQLR